MLLLKFNFPIDVLGKVLPFIFLIVIFIQCFGVQLYIFVITKFLFFSFGNFLVDCMDLFKHFYVSEGNFGVLTVSRFLLVVCTSRVTW